MFKSQKPDHFNSPEAYSKWHQMAIATAGMLTTTNERFDKGRFLTACGVAV